MPKDVFYKNPLLMMLLICFFLKAGEVYADETRYILKQDRYITGLIQSVISTQEENSLVIMVARDVYASNAMVVVIPKGTSMTCVSSPQRKMMIIECNRALLAESRAELYYKGLPLFRGSLTFHKSQKTLPQASRVTLQPIIEISF